MTVESFLFRVDRLQELYDLSRQQVFREFHLLLAGAATKWYWQLMEDKAEDYDFDYYSLTQEMRRAFSTTGSDLMKVKELMERKQGPHETFSDYVSDMHNLHFKLKHKIAEDEFVELLKDNMNSQMGGLLLTSPITSLAELKREGLRVDRWLRNTGRNMRSRAAINEIEEFQTLEDLPDAVTVEEFNRQRKDTRGRYEDGQGCRGPLHALVCYKCGKGADFYRKHPSKEESCPIKFHDATCRFCEKVGTDADANPAAFARSPSGKTGTAGRTRTNPFR